MTPNNQFQSPDQPISNGPGNNNDACVSGDLVTIETFDLHALCDQVFSEQLRGEAPADWLKGTLHKESDIDHISLDKNKYQSKHPMGRCNKPPEVCATTDPSPVDKKNHGKPTWLSVLTLLLTLPCNQFVVRNERHRDTIHGKEYGRLYSKIDWQKTFKLWKHEGRILPKKEDKDYIKRHMHISLQNMKGMARSLCVHRRDGVIDIDLVNAHPRIMLDLLQQNNFPGGCEYLSYYCNPENRDMLIADIAHCFGKGDCKQCKGEAKSLMGYLALYQRESWNFDSWLESNGIVASDTKEPIHGSTSLEWLFEYLNGYISEMKRARRWLLQQESLFGLDTETINGPRFMEIAKQKSQEKQRQNKKPNTIGTALSYLLQSCEYEIVSRAIQCATSPEDSNASLLTPIHDGFLLQLPAGTNKSELNGRLANINNSIPLSFPSSQFITKPFAKCELSADCPPETSPWTEEHGKACVRMAHDDHSVSEHQFTNCANPENTYSEPFARNIEFKNSHGVKAVRSPTGSGKSHQNRCSMLTLVFGWVFDFVKNAYDFGDKILRPNPRILVISSRVALDQELYKRMDAELRNKTYNSMGFEYYKHFVNDGQGHENDLEGLQEQPRLVIQVDSIHKLTGCEYDLVIIDEANSVLEQVMQSGNNTAAHKQLQRLVRDTPQVILQDAFLDEEVATFLQTVDRDDVEWIDNQYKPMAEHGVKRQMQVEFEWDSERGEDSIVADLEAGRKLFVGSTSYASAVALIDLVRERVKGRPVKIEWIFGDARMDGPSDKEEKTRMLNNLNVATEDCDLFIVTPCVAIGNSVDHGLGPDGNISTNKEELERAFDKAYLLVEPHSISARDVVQMANRIRHLKEQQITILLNSKKHDFKDRRRGYALMEKLNYIPVTKDAVMNTMVNALNTGCDTTKVPHISNLKKESAQTGITRGIGTDIEQKILDPSLCHSNGLIHIFAAQEAERCNRHMYMLDHIEALFKYMGACITHLEESSKPEMTKKEKRQHEKEPTIKKGVHQTIHR